MIRFLLDEHLDHRVAVQLRRLGVDVVTVAEVWRRSLSDDSHLTWAFDAGYVIVTLDSDFLELGWSAFPHGGVVYLTKDYGIGQLVDLLFTFAQVHAELGFESQVEYL